MTSQAQGFVHLLAASADGSHKPQIFRMRWDQPLRRFARAYAVFRELGAGADHSLSMSTQSHGALEPAASASVYGLSDGDKVTFTLPGAIASASSGKCAELDRQIVPAEIKIFKCPMPYCKDAGARKGFVVESEYKQHLRSHFLSALDQVKPGSTERPNGSRAELGRRGCRMLGRTPSDPPSQGQSSAPGLTSQVGAVSSKGTRQVQPKAKAKANVKGKAKSKAKAKAKSKALGAGKNCTALVTGSAAEDGTALPAEPNVRRGLMRTTTVVTGPAKGWKVTAWLQQQTGNYRSNSHANIIKWRMVSPERTRVFDTFTSGRGTPNLRDAVSEGVYTQIHEAVRPGLLKLIRCRRVKVEASASRKRRRTSLDSHEDDMVQRTAQESPVGRHGSRPRAFETPTAPAPRRRRELAVETPAPLQAPASRAQQRKLPPVDAQMKDTQAPLPQKLPAIRAMSFACATQSFVAAPEDNWGNCNCKAHLRRHPRCIFVGRFQPTLVHLKDYMLIGRAESCDLVLDSIKTPQMLSRAHAVLHCVEGRFSLIDQGSLNGVLVNGERLRERQVLANGDAVTFGVHTPNPELDYVFEVRPREVPPFVAA